MEILFFAQARDAAGCERALGPAKEITEEELWKWLLENHPALQSLQGVTRIACNEQYLIPGQLICPGDQVALIPPVSGG